VLVIAVLLLEVLRAQEQPLGPGNLAVPGHAAFLPRAPGTVPSRVAAPITGAIPA
jgi:hypothetical protein